MIALWITLSSDSDDWLFTACTLPALQAFVVTPRLELLVAEILDRLVIEQAVDRTCVRFRIELVHLPAKAGPPLGDQHRAKNVERQCARGDRDECPVVASDQDRRYQTDLDERRQNREQREIDQRRNAARAALDVAGQAARLSRQMEAQRQRVQVAEHFERDIAHRALRHLGEQVFAKLGKRRRRQPQRAISDQQRQRHDEDCRRLVEAVDDLLQQHRHTDVGDLGADQRGQRRDDAPFVGPQIRQQVADRPPIGIAARLGRSGQRHR
jgi:hypothetical protein